MLPDDRQPNPPHKPDPPTRDRTLLWALAAAVGVALRSGGLLRTDAGRLLLRVDRLVLRRRRGKHLADRDGSQLLIGRRLLVERLLKQVHHLVVPEVLGERPGRPVGRDLVV